MKRLALLTLMLFILSVNSCLKKHSADIGIIDNKNDSLNEIVQKNDDKENISEEIIIENEVPENIQGTYLNEPYLNYLKGLR
jgi:hypothetical protein